MPPKHPNFFVPVRALSVLFRAKMRHALAQAHLLEPKPEKTWTQPWVVHGQHAGAGQKVLGYLARFVFRVAIANSRLESFADGHVTFRYRDNRTQQLQHVTLRAEEFIGRFMQHILPRGFPKVRYYGLASASRQEDREQARALLKPNIANNTKDAKIDVSLPASQASVPQPLCPHCRIGHLIVVQLLRPAKKISTLMSLLSFHPRLLHPSSEPDPAGTSLAAPDRRKSLQSPFRPYIFPACIRTNRLPSPPQPRDCPVPYTPS